jgi:hypothetical protein
MENLDKDQTEISISNLVSSAKASERQKTINEIFDVLGTKMALREDKLPESILREVALQFGYEIQKSDFDYEKQSFAHKREKLI